MKTRTNLKILVVAILIAMVCFALLKQRSNQSKRADQNTQPISTKGLAINAPSTIDNTAIQQSHPLGETPSKIFQEAQARAERMKQDSDREIAMWRGPILFYGKVVDESNQPISAVQVSYSANAMDELRKEMQNTGAVFTDDRGIFRIDKVNGVGAMLELSHSNYYCYPDNINSFDKRGVANRESLPNSENFARIFRMHSKGHPVPLVL